MEKAHAILSKLETTNDPGISIELIMTVVALILQQCDLTSEQIADRVQQAGLFDRVRFRIHLTRQRVGNPGATTQAFFNLMRLENRTDLTEAIEELRECCDCC